MTTASDLQTDLFVQQLIDWHFDPRTGSPFWLRRAKSLPFDPREDVRSWSDLTLFPDVSDEWKDTPASQLIPRASRSEQAPMHVFDSGGTTGRPKRIVESTSRRDGVLWVSEVLNSHGVPGVDGGSWLHIGPTGPHIVGRSIGLLAQLRRSLCFSVDFDPRWVKRCLRAGDTSSVAGYVSHVVDQAVDILQSQDVSVVFLTPPILEAICRRPAAFGLLGQRAKAIIWAGTSMSAETIHLVEEELFPDVPLVGLYGNTLMGIAPQRPRRPDDDQPCVFQPFRPSCQIELVDYEDQTKLVDYGDRGRVKFTLLSRDMFVPNCVERDTAIRVRPTIGFEGDGVAQIEPLPSASSDAIVGVY